MTYVHRIGRTARAGKKGTSVTFVDWDDVPRWKLICDTLDLPFHDPVETYSTSPHLRSELDIPDGITGRLPRAARTREGLDAERIEDLGGRDPKGCDRWTPAAVVARRVSATAAALLPRARNVRLARVIATAPAPAVVRAVDGLERCGADTSVDRTPADRMAPTR